MKNRKITKKVVKEIKEEIDYWVGIQLSDEQVLNIMEDEELKNDWDKNGDIDTVFREKFLDVLSKKCGMKTDWPIGETNKKESDKWFKSFYKKAQKMGYTIREKVKNEE